MTHKNENSDFVLLRAAKNDVPKVADLYRGAVGYNNSVWTEEYPTLKDAENDFELDSLFVFKESGNVIGAVSCEVDEIVDALSCWHDCSGNHCDIARIVIAREFGGRGLAKKMLSLLFDILKNEGKTSVRLLVAEQNPAAMNTYKKLGFEFHTKCDAYGHTYFACELRLKGAKPHMP